MTTDYLVAGQKAGVKQGCHTEADASLQGQSQFITIVLD